jgi:carbamoyl-phosphate synthase large subunit
LRGVFVRSGADFFALYLPMPKDTSIKKILVVGSGPIVIGQGCEFDYSGVQACKALKEEGYTVILVNSNPATIMTDPEFAHRTYIEPITPEVVEKIIAAEKPDALLPTLGGQTALNCSMKLHELGVLEKHGVRMIGAKPEAIHKGEDRLAFKEAMLKIGLDMPMSGVAHTMEEGRKIAAEIGRFPLIIRPAFTLGGSGGGIAYNKEEFETIVTRGLDLSPVTEVLIEESLLGWKEFEMEVMRDRADNCVIICSIENVDPMGVHTGDSITVAPIQTLTDREYQLMRDASFAVIREIGVETGGSNIQFAVNPDNGRMIVIEMNPRVSRSSALASKATGFPIAKIAAKLAVGYTLDEVRNDITRETPASFEPTIDYVVVKCPRFTFEKFPQADPVLTTQMKSVGEAMAIGRTFKEALQKALRSLEIKRFGLIGDGKDAVVESDDALRTKLTVSNAERIFFLALAFERGWTVEQVFEATKIDRWFLENIREVVAQLEPLIAKRQGAADEKTPRGLPTDGVIDELSGGKVRQLKKLGFSDQQLAHLTGTTFKRTRDVRKSHSISPTYRLVDTCAAEFEAYTPYYYSTYGDENERRESGKKKVIILGGGPNRIGQGIEFDYCCVHAAFALREMGFETIMVNSNPETVSTDYDTSDKLYFEPLTLEDVLNICEQESENLFGVIVQFGGQTPLNLANGLAEAGVPIIGTSPRSIEIAEDRKLFGAMLDKLGIRQTSGGTALNEDEAVAVANRVGYPVLVRPSFVLGGRGMMLVHTEADLRKYVREAMESGGSPLGRGTAVPAVGGNSPTGVPPVPTKHPFLPFNPAAPIEKKRRNLPHWRQRGATYFVTFRLADSLPASLLADWREELATWLHHHPHPWSGAVEKEYDERFTRRLDGWLNEGHGCCLLRRTEAAEIVAQAIEHFDGERYALDAYVVMPNHVHVLLQPLGEHELSDILHSWKSFTGHELRKLPSAPAEVWMDESYDHIVRNWEALQALRLYVQENPAKAGLRGGEFVLGGEHGLWDAEGREGVRASALRRRQTGEAPMQLYQPTAGTAGPQPEPHGGPPPGQRPILVDHFLEDATEVDVDCISDGETVVIGAIMEHIEQAGIHSGDSACVIPPFSLSEKVKAEIVDATKKMARELNVIGLMNVQFAVQNENVYVLEVNPRASRTAPFVSKAIGVPLPKLAAKIMAGQKLKDLGFTKEVSPSHYSVKEAVFPFIKFPGVDIVLGPEMKSTGEVMGIDANLGLAYAKAQMAAQPALPSKGNVFVSVADNDKTKVAEIAKGYVDLGFTLYATSGTAAALEKAGVPVKKLFKLAEGRPNALDMLKNGELALIINTPSGKTAREDEAKIRSTASSARVPVMTTLRAARASLEGIRSMRDLGLRVKPLQEWHDKGPC